MHTCEFRQRWSLAKTRNSGRVLGNPSVPPHRTLRAPAEPHPVLPPRVRRHDPGASRPDGAPSFPGSRLERTATPRPRPSPRPTHPPSRYYFVRPYRICPTLRWCRPLYSKPHLQLTSPVPPDAHRASSMPMSHMRGDLHVFSGRGMGAEIEF